MRSSRVRRGQARLRSLEATNLFVIPMDRQREWYRYHALYREFLLDELQRTEPEIIPKLHLRAADWYESNGSPQLAVDHLLHTDERDRCVQLVTTLVLPTYSAGQISTVEQWLTTLGDASIERHPPLAVLAGWVAVLTGHTADAERWAAIADGQFVGTDAAGRNGVLRIGASDAACRDVRRRARRDDPRRRARRR